MVSLLGRDARLRLASISILTLLGALAGCGDDSPSRKDGGGGSGGTAGMGGSAGSKDGGADVGGSAGTDAGIDGDAAGMDTMGETPKPCYAVTFVKPLDMATLSAADDKSGDNCADGFQYDVQISTDAPDGADVTLFAGNALLQTVKVMTGKATFTSVQLASTGDTLLSIQFPSRETCTAATSKAKITVDCKVPACSISKPTISGAHPALNGVPSTQGGDRVSAAGSPYQASFEVTTDIADGQPVTLLVDNAATPATVSTVTGTAMGGKATFAGVTLTPDAVYEIQATCKAAVTGVVGRSMKGTYPVDTTAPDLTLSKPSDGVFLGPNDLTNGKFSVCGKTTATDAAALMAALGAGANNFCVAVGGSPNCAPVTAVNTDTCVDVTCSGSAPFDITVTLKDAAGNPVTKTITGVTCSSSLPSVQIITPVSDAPTFTDPSKHLLAATASQTFRDQNAATAGAQTDVVACASRAGSARLFAGHKGDPTLTQVGAAVNTAPAGVLDGCPAGLGFVVKFPGVTLPESTEAADGSLATSTEIRVDVTDASSSVGTSAPLDLWVDSVAPVISLLSPVGLCGSFHQAMTTFLTSIQLNSDTPNVTLTVANGTSTDTYVNPAFSGGVATFSAVAFDAGQSTVAGAATDAAGNATALQPVPCTVTVGSAPVVVFTTPTSGKQLCSAGSVAPNCINDSNPASAGWQGSLLVHASVGGTPLTTGNITFAAGGTTLGTAPLDASGNAQLNVTLLDGTITITAQTDNIPGRGVGMGSVTVVVDTGPPMPPTLLTATVLNRRETSFQLSWTAPSDNGGSVAGYQVRYAKVPITAANFDDATVTTAVTYTGSPAAPGAMDGIAVRNLYIENDYYFAVAAVDAAGSRSAILATTMPVAAHFNRTLLPSTSGTNEELGYSLSAGNDLNGDGLSDILSGTFQGGKAYLYFGSMTVAPSAPAVVFSGAFAGFGNSVAQIGDVDNDGLQDIAISDPINARQVYIYKGRLTWPATLTDAQADYVISGDATYTGSLLGTSLARLGDFTGDGIDDFAIGARGFGTSVGRVVIIPGKASGFASVALPDAANSIIIDGDATLGRSAFGYRVLGLGHFYSVTTGTTLVVSAPGLVSSATANAGHVYAFHGQTGTAGAIALASADQVIAGPASGARIGLVLSNLGPLLGSLPAVGIGNPSDTVDAPGISGAGYVTSGTVATGPLGNRVLMTLGGGGGGGGVILGGGLSGRDVSLSLIGDAKPDLVFGAEASSVLTISDGAKLPSKGSSIETTATAEVKISLPAGWSTGEGAGSLIADVNGDGIPDFCIASSLGAVPGSIAIYW